MTVTLEARGGAKFFDSKKRAVGSAVMVVERTPSVGRMTVLDVTVTEPDLASFLRTLDKRKILVRCTDSPEQIYKFAWASGYANGGEIRVRGVLEGK